MSSSSLQSSGSSDTRLLGRIWDWADQAVEPIDAMDVARRAARANGTARGLRGLFAPASATASAVPNGRRRSGSRSRLTAARLAVAVCLVTLSAGALFMAVGQDPSLMPMVVPATGSPSPTTDGARTIVVAQDGSGDVPTIADGVALAVDGDTVLIRPGTYVGGVTVTEDISILGDGPRDQIVVELTDKTPRRVWVGPGEIPFGFVFQATDAHLADLTIRALNRELVGHETHARHLVVVVAGGSPVLERLAIQASDYAFDISTGLDQRVTVRDSSWTGEFGCGDGGCNLTMEANVVSGHVSVSSGAVVRNNTIAGFAVNVPGSPVIEDNLITGSTDYGIIAGLDSRAVIRGNHIADNPVGILVREGGAPLVQGNVIEENSMVGILVAQGAPIIRGNKVCGNGVDVVGVDVDRVARVNEVCP